jgi:hypothetical protein
MTKDDIIRMAREAGWKDLPTVRLAFAGFDLHRFANLVAAAEREDCAKLCDAVQQQNENNGAFMWEAKNCATAIRARGNT